MLDRKAKRYGQKPSSWLPWLHPATANDFDDGVCNFGLWFDGKMAETTGTGKNMKPAHDPYELLGLPHPNAARRSIHQYQNTPGVGIHTRSVAPTVSPEPFVETGPRPPWERNQAN